MLIVIIFSENTKKVFPFILNQALFFIKIILQYYTCEFQFRVTEFEDNLVSKYFGELRLAKVSGPEIDSGMFPINVKGKKLGGNCLSEREKWKSEI